MENIDIYDSLLLQIENLDEYNEDRIEIYKKQAEQGDYKAQYKLGEKYYKGFELKRDLDEADRLFTSSYRTCSMRGDDPEALYYIFLMNFNGYGIPKNNERAFDFCKKSAELGCDDAKFQLAIMYFNGYGVKQNYLEAIKLLEELSKFKKENVSVNAKFFLGLAYKTLIENKNKFSIKNVKKYIKELDKNFKDCIKFYENKAKQSDSLSQFRLGYIYLKGLGVKKDIEKALELFKKSAELGYSDSEYQIGKNFYFGSKSLIYLEKSACKGNLKALYKLGEIYQYGFNAVSKNYKKSIECYIKSAEFGYNEANRKLDSFVENYKDSKKRNNYDNENKEEKTIEYVYATFFEYFEKLAEKGNAFALYRLGQMYENGVGIDIYNKKAFELYKKSAEQGNLEAKYALGNMYEKGKGIGVDESKALDLYDKVILGGEELLSNLHTNNIKSCKSISLSAQKNKNYIDKKNKMFFCFNKNIIFNNEKCFNWLLNNNFCKNVDKIYAYLLFSLWNINNQKILNIATYNLAILLFDEKDFVFDLKTFTYLALKFFFKKSPKYILSKFFYIFYKKYRNFRYIDSFGCIDYNKLNDFDNNSDIAITFYAISSYFGNSEARRNLENIALQNNSLAQYYIGNIYLKGLSEKQDYDKAIFYFSLAGEQGNMFAQLTLADLYLSGNDIEINYDKAIYWFSKAGEHKNKNACYRLGQIYRYIKKDYDKAIYWYKKSAEQGYEFAQLSLGDMFYIGKGVEQNYIKAFEWYIKSAEQGNAFAQNNLGFMYQKGLGVKRDYIKAFEWYIKSAEQGNAFAQNNLGFMYQKGLGLKRDYIKAFEWYIKSAEQGNAFAQKNLGDIYSMGLGVSIDVEESNKWYMKSLEWYIKSAEQGNAFAQNNLGFMYQKGLGVEQDYTKAFELYSKSAEQEEPLALYHLGCLYLQGLGIEENEREAEKCFVMALKCTEKLEQNDFGLCYLGDMYLRGLGTKQDYSKAFEYYYKSAERCNDIAEYNLGKIYEQGLGVEKDINKALEYYKRSAEQGKKEAKCALEILENKG